MIHIAICDDERAFISRLQAQINQYAAEAKVEMKTTAYLDGLELIEKYDSTIDLIFLDIRMETVDGLKTAEHIRRLDEKVEIIFLTTQTQFALEGYTYHATNYIIKPLGYARLKSELDKFLIRHKRADTPFITISNDAGKYKIFLDSLRFIETWERNLLFHTEQANIVCYQKMKSVEQELAGYGFARCHTSYLVNLFYVKGVVKLEIELITGEIIPISQPKRKEFMERLTDYWGNML